MTCKECGQVVKLTRTINKCHSNTELSSHEETRCQFNGGRCAIKLGIDVHQDFYVVVEQAGGSNPKPPQRFQKEAFLSWAARLKQKSGAQVYALYEACGFGFSLQRKLSALSIVRVPSEEEEQARAIHRQREQLVKARKQLEAQGRSLMVNHGLEPVQNWWKPRTFTALPMPQWMKELLANSQPILVALQQKDRGTDRATAKCRIARPTMRLGKMTSVIIDREIGDWNRFNNRRQIASYTGLCPSEYSSGNTRVQSCVTKHGNPRLRAALVELAWRLVRFQPNYKPVVKWRQILAPQPRGALATGAARKKAIVAVARQLAVDLWRIKTGRLTAEQLGLTI